jgi:predicted O-methyltransferase YrrM
MSSFQQTVLTALTTSAKAQCDLVKPNTRLDEAVTNAKKNKIPSIAISPSQGRMLSILCQLVQAKNILEIGTLGAYSTIWLAESVPGVHVTSLEFNPKHRDVALENLKGLDNVEIRLGAALDSLPVLEKEGKTFDFIFIDADWENQANYFAWAVKLVRNGGAIYVDNVVREITESDAAGDKSGWALIEHVKANEKVDATLIPTLSTHKTNTAEIVDGFVLAIKK